MNSNVKQAVLWIVLLCVAALIWIVVRSGRGGSEQQLSFTQFMNQVEQGKVKSVTISGYDVKGSVQRRPASGFASPAELPRPVQAAARQERRCRYSGGQFREPRLHSH